MIGLDGATFEIIDPLLRRGALPTISSLIERGTRGKLRSTIPPATIPALPSFMTGKNPGKHGVFDFLVRGKDGKPKLASSKSIVGKKLWQILDENGKTCVALNLPLTYPPDRTRGALVSGMLSPSEGYTYPASLEKELGELGYIKDIETDLIKKMWNKPVFIHRLKSMAEKRAEATRWLMGRYDWDLFITYFRCTDELQHMRWSDQEVIEDLYRHLDNLLEGIVREAGNDVDLILWSDHGFGPLDYYFHVNKWLVDRGYAYLRKRGAPSDRGRKHLFASIGVTQDRIRRVVEALRMDRLLDFVPNTWKESLAPTDLEVDTSRSKAFFASFVTGETQSINVNLAGRESDGIVEAEEYEGLRKRIASEIGGAVNPLNGEKVVERVLTREQVYRGPFVDRAPDLIVVPSRGYKLVGYYLPRSTVTEVRQPRGRHEIDGIFVGCGPSFGKGLITGASIYDLAPTVLHLMDLTIPSSMDGRVLSETLKNATEAS